MQNTIDPTGSFFVSWEIFRSISAMVNISLSVLYIPILFQFNVSYIHYSLLSLRVIYLIDIYIRMHCKFYNRKGILVTHALLTAKHYMHTSFTVDFISSFPVLLLPLFHMFFTKYGNILGLCFNFMARFLQLHRPFNGMSYLQKTIFSAQASLIAKIKITIVLLVILNVTANILMLKMCSLKDKGVECSGVNFITQSMFKDEISAIKVFVYCLYMTCTVFTHSLCGVFGVQTPEELRFFLVLTAVLFLIRCFILAIFTSIGVSKLLTIR